MTQAATEGGSHKKDVDYGKIRLFVYGTLKKSKCNNVVLIKSDAKFLGYDTITVPNAAFMDLGGFPALVYPITGANNNSQLIRGEVWYGGQEMMKSVDILEGHPLFYRRHKHWTDRLARRVWTYSVGEDWIAEGEDFINNSWWKPEDAEKEFWKLQTAGKII